MKQENNVYIKAPEGYRVIGYRVPDEGECYMKQTAERDIIIPNAKRTKLFVYPILEKIKPEKPEFKLFKIHNNKGYFEIYDSENGIYVRAMQNIVVDGYTIIGFTDSAFLEDYKLHKNNRYSSVFSVEMKPHTYAVGRKFNQ